MTFGTLLRDWRTRRRFSQLDLALSADVSTRHVSYLETGRSVPSRDMVLRLSDTLQIPRGERNALLDAAGFAPVYRRRDWQDAELSPIRDAVGLMLSNHDPYPGFALDRHWRLLQVNHGAESLLGAADLTLGDSLLDAITSDTALSHTVENLDEVRAHMRQRLRAESLYLGGDARLDAAVAKLESAAPISGPQPAVTPVVFRLGDLRLSFVTTLAHFGSTEDIALADMKIELMFPADPATKSHFERDIQER